MIVIGAFKFMMGGWRSYFNLFSARKMKQCSKSNRVELVLGWISQVYLDVLQKLETEIALRCLHYTD